MFGVSVLILIIVLYKVPGLYHNRNIKELTYFFILLTISAIYAYLVLAEVIFISPFDIIIYGINKILSYIPYSL
mgnify:CR=1 FL=1